MARERWVARKRGVARERGTNNSYIDISGILTTFIRTLYQTVYEPKYHVAPNLKYSRKFHFKAKNRIFSLLFIVFLVILTLNSFTAFTNIKGGDD